MTTAATLLRTITPLHVGTGQAVGPVDLPIARERSTHWPIVPGSSFKGILRDAAMQKIWGDAPGDNDDKKIEWCHARLKEEYGVASDDGASYAGRLATTDQRILLFPVRSYLGTFAYVTCPLALQRFTETLELAGQTAPPISTLLPDTEILLTPTTKLADEQGQVYLEDLDLASAQADESLERLGEFLAKELGLPPSMIVDRLAVVTDTLFSFLVENATEVITHVSLNFTTKTARDGFLRNEEAVPAEAVFVGLATVLRGDASPLAQVTAHAGRLLQFGGKASVGMGLCKLSVVGSSK